jgi:hypothetical protein
MSVEALVGGARDAGVLPGELKVLFEATGPVQILVAFLILESGDAVDEAGAGHHEFLPRVRDSGT